MAARSVLHRVSIAAGSVGLAVACGNLIGIEELKTESRPGVGGAAGSDTSSGTSGTGGSGGSGLGNAGRGGGGGSDLASSGSGGLPQMPTAGTGGGPDAGAGEIVVTGRVIDFFRRPVPEVPVTIGGTTVATNARGEFSIGGVTAPYDASLMLNTARNGGVARYGYVYEGLTRADPTLQVYTALPSRSASSISIAYQDVILQDDDLHYVIVAWSSPDGVFVRQASGPTEYVLEPSWAGPAATAGTIHALDTYKDVADEPPVAYQAYQASPLTVSDSQPASVGFNLPFDPSIVTDTISGTATHQGGASSSTNSVSLLFGDGTGMPLVEATPTGDAFSYFAPILAGSSLVVAASDGIIAPYGVAHRGNLAVGQTDVALTVPRPVNLSSPQSGAPVTPSTFFSWSRLSQTAQTFLWHLEFNATYEGMYVLTSRASIELPQFPDRFTVPPGTEVTWSVETHGDAPNVDAAAGPNGYLDSFAFGTTYPIGPNRSDGYYTESERRGFTMGDAVAPPP